MREAFSAIASTRRQQAKALDMLAKRLREASTPADLGHVLELGAALVAQALDVEFAEVSHLLPGGTSLKLCAGIGWQRDVVNAASIDLAPGTQALHVLGSGVPLVMTDLLSEARFEPWPLLREHGVNCGVCVPILASGRALGVLGAYSRRRKTFRWDDVDFMEVVADIMGNALEKARAASAQPLRMDAPSARDLPAGMLERHRALES